MKQLLQQLTTEELKNWLRKNYNPKKKSKKYQLVNTLLIHPAQKCP